MTEPKETKDPSAPEKREWVQPKLLSFGHVRDITKFQKIGPQAENVAEPFGTIGPPLS